MLWNCLCYFYQWSAQPSLPICGPDAVRFINRAAVTEVETRGNSENNQNWVTSGAELETFKVFLVLGLQLGTRQALLGCVVFQEAPRWAFSTLHYVGRVTRHGPCYVVTALRNAIPCLRMPNTHTHTQSCEHACRWPRCGEVSMSKTKTEWNKLGFLARPPQSISWTVSNLSLEIRHRLLDVKPKTFLMFFFSLSSA